MTVTYEDYTNWVRKNWFTVVGIIVILSITWYQVSTVEVTKIEIAVACNEHWMEEIEKACPSILNDGYKPSYMLHNLSIGS